MAKRFTDTGKWDKAWFRTLEPGWKCVWMFLCDRCDHAGIWEIDEASVLHFIGAPISIESILKKFAGRLERAGDDKLFLSGFIEFQYGTLNADNRVHKSVLSRLEKLKIKGLTSPLQGAKDKDKDKDTYKEKEKDKDPVGQSILTSEGKARISIMAVQRFGPDASDELREFVGEQLYEQVRTTCGWQSIRELKRDNFALMNLTRSLGGT